MGQTFCTKAVIPTAYKYYVRENFPFENQNKTNESKE